MDRFKSSRELKHLLLICASFLICACNSLGSNGEALKANDNGINGSHGLLGSFGELDRQNGSTRATASFDSSAKFIGRSVVLDPIVRPVSTIKALYGVTLKSASGLLERAVIEQVGFPRLERNPIPDISDAAPMNIAAWEDELDQLTGTTRSSGKIRFLVDGDEYFPRLVQAFEQSEHSIDALTYIFDNDDVSLEIGRLLRRRSEHVDVRILVDSLADLVATRLDSHSMPDDVILPSSIADFLSYESNVEFRKQSNPWFTGDHAKITLVDSSLAFVGGMNIGREYRYDWHDMMMEVEGPVVGHLQFEFNKSWAKSGMMGDLGWLIASMKGYEIDQSSDGIPIRMLTTSIHDSKLYRAQIAAIRRAQNRIYIENAYFSDDKILFELARARRRGVDVRVILGSENDSGVLNLSNQAAVNTMLEHGIRVYSYPGMTHVKAAVYDGWACTGSANFDKLSLQINREINLAFSDKETVDRLLNRVFYPDFQASRELRQPYRIGIRHRFAEMIADEMF